VFSSIPPGTGERIRFYGPPAAHHFGWAAFLCLDKSEAVVRYTLPEDNNQIFASRYKLYLPTEDELAAEIIKERQAIEMEQRLSGKESKSRKIEKQ
jgi:hypothetical protein